MKLRYKFGLLGGMYAVTLAANVGFCSWSLLVYYQSFLMRTASEPFATAAVAGAEQWDAEAEHAPDGLPNDALAGQVLGINAVCGIGLGLLGLRLVRRWVMRPLAGLRAAAVELGRGNLRQRAEVSGRDELGDLATEINTMAASITDMQDRLLEQERRQVAAQALRCIVHNVRSPLTGIRWLAEAVSMRPDVNAQTLSEQSRIMQAVDEILSWLQEFRASLEQASGGTSPSFERTNPQSET